MRSDDKKYNVTYVTVVALSRGEFCNVRTMHHTSRQAFSRAGDDSSAKSAIERPDAASSRGHLRGPVPRFIRTRDAAPHHPFSTHTVVALFQDVAAEH